MPPACFLCPTLRLVWLMNTHTHTLSGQRGVLLTTACLASPLLPIIMKKASQPLHSHNKENKKKKEMKKTMQNKQTV
jgi:hypothetical protein